MKWTTIIVLALLTAGITVMSAFGLESSVAVGLSKELLPIAAIVFGIIGAWVAVLNPTAVLDAKPSDTSSAKVQLTTRFASLVVVATFVFAASVILRVVVGVVPIDVMNGFPQRLAIFGAVYGLYGAEVYVLIGTLMPVARSVRKMKQDEFRMKNRP